jgi:hypothetical protein
MLGKRTLKIICGRNKRDKRIYIETQAARLRKYTKRNKILSILPVLSLCYLVIKYWALTRKTCGESKLGLRSSLLSSAHSVLRCRTFFSSAWWIHLEMS